MRLKGEVAGKKRGMIPWPVIGFTTAAAIHYFVGGTHVSLWHATSLLGHALMVLALASIGLVTHLGEIWRKGRRALGVGALTWLALSLFSLLMVKTVGSFG